MRGRIARDRRIVGANDGHVDRAGRGAILRRDGEVLGQGLAGLQVLHLGQRVIQLVAPVAVGVDSERAVLARHACLGLHIALIGIRIRDRELAAGEHRRILVDLARA
ncbi:hypothetical protein D3C73_1243890 [compost metagenome]